MRICKAIRALQAGEAMVQVTGAIDGVAALMAEIASASAEQATGIEQVNRAVSQMDEVTQQNAALVEQAAAAGSLVDQAKALKAHVSFFRISNENIAFACWGYFFCARESGIEKMLNKNKIECIGQD